jgi:GT2 family glycosyltransferase
MSALISVVIPTLHARRWLPACLTALNRQICRDFEVVIIDNSPNMDARDVVSLQELSGVNVRLISNPANSGFADSVNQGIRSSLSEFVSVLNDDTEPEPQWLSELLKGFETPNLRIGSCASLMLFASKPDVIQSAGIAIDRAAIAWDWLGGRRRADAPGEITPIFGASAGAALYSRAMLREVGLFDERFYMYMEDVDLAWRAQRMGWDCVLAPQAVVLHATSASAGEGSPFKQRLLGRNKVFLVAKNARLRDLPIITLYDFAAVPYAGIVRGEWAHLAGRLAGYKQMGMMLRDRQSTSDRALPFSPLVPPWRVPKRVAHLS